MSELTAIDILINPDEATIQRAREVNARMLKSVPGGWALDDTHRPHITTLQRYVRTADLDHVYDAVATTVADTDMASLSYNVDGIESSAAWGPPGQGGAALRVQPSPQVLDFQAALLAAVTPFAGADGTPAAFVTDPGEEINQTTMDWVKSYQPNQIGANYTAHLTVGFATITITKRKARLHRGWQPTTTTSGRVGASLTAAARLRPLGALKRNHGRSLSIDWRSRCHPLSSVR